MASKQANFAPFRKLIISLTRSSKAVGVPTYVTREYDVAASNRDSGPVRVGLLWPHLTNNTDVVDVLLAVSRYIVTLDDLERVHPLSSLLLGTFADRPNPLAQAAHFVRV